MPRRMYDSTSAADIPATAQIVGGYDDGIFAWSAADWARFPNAVKAHISAVGTNTGTVGDVEKGCIWPPSAAVPWVQKRRAAGIDPTIYCNETYDWPQVRAAFRAAGVPEPHYWCANYDNIAVLKPGQVARQYANPTITGKHYDLSVVADYWPGVDGQGGYPVGTVGNLPDPWLKDMNARQGSFLGVSGSTTTAPITVAQLDKKLDIILAKLAAGSGGSVDLGPLTKKVDDLAVQIANLTLKAQ